MTFCSILTYGQKVELSRSTNRSTGSQAKTRSVTWRKMLHTYTTHEGRFAPKFNACGLHEDCSAKKWLIKWVRLREELLGLCVNLIHFNLNLGWETFWHQLTLSLEKQWENRIALRICNFLISFTRERRIKLQSDSQVRKWVFLSDDEFKCPLTKDSLTKSLSHSQLMASTVIL